MMAKRILQYVFFQIGYLAARIYVKTHPDLYRPVAGAERTARGLELLP
jgi:hypothetical protein